MSLTNLEDSLDSKRSEKSKRPKNKKERIALLNFQIYSDCLGIKNSAHYEPTPAEWESKSYFKIYFAFVKVIKEHSLSHELSKKYKTLIKL